MSEVNISERVQTHAYHLWKEAGEPQGEDVKFWLMAESSILPISGFAGKTVVIMYEGCELHVKTESTTATDCHGYVVNEPEGHLAIGLGDLIVYTPEEVTRIL